jgi:hypothetical protein
VATQTSCVTEADPKARESVGKAMAPQDACVLKVVRADTAIVPPLHLPTVVSQQMTFAAPSVLATTAELCATTEDLAVPFTKHRPMAELATWLADSAV